jgi:serine protease DegQ
MLKRFWLGLTQVTTVLVLIFFIFWALKPQWLPSSAMQWLSSGKINAGTNNVSLKPSIAPSNMAGLSYHDAVKIALPSVVKVQAVRSMSDANSDAAMNEISEQAPPQNTEEQGSGVILDAQGYIVTNYHVIQNADKIQVYLNNGSKVPAVFVGADPDSDLAVLKIEAEGLVNITLGHDKDLQIGDVVLAIGNPFDVGQSVSMGIVSALHRNQLGISTFEDFIQTDAAINHGNSGGALVDSNGNLVGINTAIWVNNDKSTGVGFAIPASTMQEIAKSIIETGEYVRGYVGVSTQILTPVIAKQFNYSQPHGVIVSGLAPSAPAADAGLIVGDILMKLNDAIIKGGAQMKADIALLKPGSTALFTVFRKGQEMEVAVVVGKRPSTQVAK